MEEQITIPRFGWETLKLIENCIIKKYYHHSTVF